MKNTANDMLAYLKRIIDEGQLKNTNQLIAYLKTRFDVVDFPLDKISYTFLNVMKSNALQHSAVPLAVEALNFHAIKILNTEQSIDYFSQELTDFTSLEFPVESPEEKELLLCLFEEQSQYFWVSHNLLHCELIIERGIDQASLKNKNLLYLEYESSKKFACEYWERIENYHKH